MVINKKGWIHRIFSENMEFWEGSTNEFWEIEKELGVSFDIPQMKVLFYKFDEWTSHVMGFVLF